MWRIGLVLALSLLAAPLAGEAQRQSSRHWRIGFLAERARPASLASDAYGGFLQGMREKGYVEGRTFIIEWRFANGDDSRLPGLAAELVRLKVDVIVVSTPLAIPAVQHVTTSIPVVMGISLDPVAAGFVASLARPGGNITGLAATADVNVQHLELLKTLLPRLSRTRVLVDPSDAGEAVVRVVQAAGAKVGINVLPVSAGSPEEVDRAFAIMQALGRNPGAVFSPRNYGVGSRLWTPGVDRYAKSSLENLASQPRPLEVQSRREPEPRAGRFTAYHGLSVALIVLSLATLTALWPK